MRVGPVVDAGAVPVGAMPQATSARSRKTGMMVRILKIIIGFGLDDAPGCRRCAGPDARCNTFVGILILQTWTCIIATRWRFVFFFLWPQFPPGGFGNTHGCTL